MKYEISGINRKQKRNLIGIVYSYIFINYVYLLISGVATLRLRPKKAAEVAGALASSDPYVREYLGSYCRMICRNDKTYCLISASRR
jgi:hypothetical protein